MSAVEQSMNGRVTMAPAARGAGIGGDTAEQENVQETITKFKRLLSLARRSIEENQRQIAEKDGQLNVLREALAAAEKARRREDDHGGTSPLQLLRRIREGGKWWLLVEYDDEFATQGWKGFADESSVQAFAASANAGEPLKIPPVSLSPDESATVLEDARRQVANIREEFRKYRVKAELGRKQREAEIRQISAESIAEKERRISGQHVAAEAGQVQALEEEVQRLQNELTDKEEHLTNAFEREMDGVVRSLRRRQGDTSWRHAYEKQVQEMETLKQQGTETALAAQWRRRYEKLSLEKEDAVAKLNMLRPNGAGGGSHGGGGGGEGEAVASLMKKYQDLKEEYKLYRKKAMHAIQQSGGGGGLGDGAGTETTDPKLQYLKNLMIKYLGTDEGEAREHMERAIATVLQFSEEERNELKEKRQAQTMVWMSNFASMFGGTSTGSTIGSGSGSGTASVSGTSASAATSVTGGSVGGSNGSVPQRPSHHTVGRRGL